MNSTNTEQRIIHIQEHIPDNTAWLLSQPEDIHYYTGFDCLVSTEREAFLILTNQKAHLIHATFSPTDAVGDHITTRAGAFAHQLPAHLQEIQTESPFSTLRIDFHHLLHSEYLAISQSASFTIEALDRSLVAQQRARKDSFEQSAITKAITITTELLKWIPSEFRVGVTETELTQKLYQKMLTLGGDITPAFPFIVAFGEHSAQPHHQPTTKKLEQNMPVLVDIGARADRYCSDMTRTFWFGSKPSEDFVKIEKTVKKAYTAAKRVAFKPQVTAQAIDTAAREVITKAGYGDQFIHTTGHGLGLEIHEQPSISWKNAQEVLPHMVITIEPGIYLPGKFGYRFENTLIILLENLLL